MTLILPALPILIPLAAAILGVLCWRSLRAQFAVAVCGSIAHALAAAFLLDHALRSGYVVLHVGSWRAPVGIAIVADPFGAMMALLASITGLAAILHARATIDFARQKRFLFPIISVLLAGVSGAFLTGDLFNLYVWFEVLLMSSFVLLALGGAKRQLQGAVTYVTLNLLSSTFFLIAAGLLYGIVGTLNYADLSVKIAPAFAARPGELAMIAVLLALAFSIKAALFPLFFWLPGSYHTPPVAIAALFAGLLTKVGVFALMRLTTLLFHDQAWLTDVLLVVSALTMLVGGVGVITQTEFRRLLAFSSVSQIGYATMGIALASPEAIAAALLFMVHHNLVKTNQFLFVDLVERVRGTTDLARPPLRGVYAQAPILSLAFLVLGLSLAGIPPLSGFVAKLALIRAGLSQGAFWVVAAALLSSLFTLLAIAKLWSEGFWKGPDPSAPPAQPCPPHPRLAVFTCGVLLAASLALGVFVQPVLTLCQQAAARALDADGYVRAVLSAPKEGTP